MKHCFFAVEVSDAGLTEAGAAGKAARRSILDHFCERAQAKFGVGLDVTFSETQEQLLVKAPRAWKDEFRSFLQSCPGVREPRIPPPVLH